MLSTIIESLTQFVTVFLLLFFGYIIIVAFKQFILVAITHNNSLAIVFATVSVRIYTI